MTNLFVLAGEKSGDLHGAHVMRALSQEHPGITFYGVGGVHMRECGLHCLVKAEELAVMGFSDVISHLPTLFRHFKTVRSYILDTKPEALLLIDYPGFNLRLAQSLRRRGYGGKIIQFICPTVWAWGHKRIKIMADTLDMLLTIYPFESHLFSHTLLDVRYVGHPIQESLAQHSYEGNWLDALGVSETCRSRPIVALFPGSRAGEIHRNLPALLEAAAELKKLQPEALFALSYSHDDLLPILMQTLTKSALLLERDLFLVPSRYTYELMRCSSAALAKSGTVTLELALHRCPTVVTYKLSTLNYLIARYLLRLNLPHYCIVNVLGEKRIFPEFISEDASPSKIAAAASLLIEEGAARENCIADCIAIKQLLTDGVKQASSISAAQAIGAIL